MQRVTRNPGIQKYREEGIRNHGIQEYREEPGTMEYKNKGGIRNPGIQVYREEPGTLEYKNTVRNKEPWNTRMQRVTKNPGIQFNLT